MAAVSSSALKSLAQMMGLEPADAIALPTTIEVSARKVGMSKDQMVRECLSNEALRDYLAGICRNAISEVVA